MSLPLQNEDFDVLTYHIFRFVLALYRVTDYFPVHEPLRYQLRSSADDFFVHTMRQTQRQDTERIVRLLVYIEEIRQYLCIARYARFASEINVHVLEQECIFLKGEFEKRTKSFAQDVGTRLNQVAQKKVSDGTETRIGKRTIVHTTPLNERERRIISYLGSDKQASCRELVKRFPGISAKTLQRDLQNLVKKKMVKTQGIRRWMTYTRILLSERPQATFEVGK
ncbi:MAG: hypothetical protein G01um101466_182 [Parcubacteria group bacterium Gr01-1014_66]|nr:MAG: hypothetical protein G01um101466_182 [Parcubacteria group bacterium Gr01-1014_66]